MPSQIIIKTSVTAKFEEIPNLIIGDFETASLSMSTFTR